MKIFNCSRKYLETRRAELEADGGLFVISINGFHKDGSGKISNEIPPINHKNRLALWFDDATDSEVGNVDIVKIFDRKMAFNILEEIESAFKNKDKKHILVHCSAGMSRSAAISTALNDFLNVVLSDNKADWEHNKKHGFEVPPIPNAYILATMRAIIRENVWK